MERKGRVPEVGETGMSTDVISLVPHSHIRFLTFLSTHPLLIHIKSKLIQCESTAIQPNIEQFQLDYNIGNPEMSDITGNE
jgi:hypothetical protein